MTLRHRKRSRHKYMGTRSWGGGNIKNRRGKGSRGGVGLGGGQDQKWTYMVKYMPDHFGKHGFHPVVREPNAVINLGEIDALAELGRLKQEGGKYVFNFSGKVLSGGKLSHPVVIHADEFSKGAEKKITAAGGQAIAKKAPERVGEGAGKGKDAKRGKKAK
ncbi:MAG: uL15m family ribosomal protein [Candidatus Burarchaeum sp.]|nr:uL15m family ribosomal protein [Candidatus Burarchaeum sp.]MDO8339381.1 uL15m family ribosomal protein [Candidatus Burarchaeum sp.]